MVIQVSSSWSQQNEQKPHRDGNLQKKGGGYINV